MIGQDRSAGIPSDEKGGLDRSLSYRAFIYTGKHRLFRARNHSVDTESFRDISRATGGEEKKRSAHLPFLLSGELFLRCLEKHCRYDNDCEGGRRKGEFIGLTMADGGPRAHRHLYATPRIHIYIYIYTSPPTAHIYRYEEELFR